MDQRTARELLALVETQIAANDRECRRLERLLATLHGITGTVTLELVQGTWQTGRLRPAGVKVEDAVAARKWLTGFDPKRTGPGCSKSSASSSTSPAFSKHL